MVNLTKGEITGREGKPISPGLQNLKVVKVSNTSVGDFGITTLCKSATNIEQIELNRLD